MFQCTVEKTEKKKGVITELPFSLTPIVSCEMRNEYLSSLFLVHVCPYALLFHFFHEGKIHSDTLLTSKDWSLIAFIVILSCTLWHFLVLASIGNGILNRVLV